MDEAREKREKKSGREIVDEVSKYIKNHLSEDLGVEEIAAQVYLNPDYLARDI